MCAELLPERVTLDEWGYPIIDGRPVHGWELEHARRAARACPTFALLVERERAPREHTRAGQSPSVGGGLRSDLR
jgi:ferredoxin